MNGRAAGALALPPPRLPHHRHERQAGRNELDLIVRRGSKLTFVEVKQRRGSGFGGAVGAVDAEKRRRVRRAAQVWLSRNPQPEYVRVGFEVVGVEDGRLVRIPASLIDGMGLPRDESRGSCRPRRPPKGLLTRMIEARGYKLVRDDPSVYRRTVCGRSTITTSSE